MLDFSQEEKKEFQLIDEGEYEFELKVEWAKTKSSNEPYINCILKIRDDVDQKFQGSLVFDGIYKSKKSGEFNPGKIKSIIEAMRNPVYKFEDYDELIQHLNGNFVRANVLIEEADETIPNSRTRNVIEYKSYKTTKYPNKGVSAPTVESVKKETESRFEEESDDDIPF